MFKQWVRSFERVYQSNTRSRDGNAVISRVSLKCTLQFKFRLERKEDLKYTENEIH